MSPIKKKEKIELVSFDGIVNATSNVMSVSSESIAINFENDFTNLGTVSVFHYHINISYNTTTLTYHHMN